MESCIQTIRFFIRNIIKKISINQHQLLLDTAFFESSDNKLVDSMLFEEKGIFAEGVTSGELKSKLANGNYFLEQGKMIITIEKKNS